MKAKTLEETYQKKTQLEHILIRPDTYIGSIELQNQTLWVWNGNEMIFKSIAFVPGLYKIVDEIIVNAADNKVRDPSMDTIKVVIDRERNEFSVYNNGRGIPIEMHAKEGIYVPELIFGHLLTSSNYDDDEEKITGGRNGYGAKLCNIFSKEFTVETADSNSSKRFKQVYKNNMSVKGDPVITTNSKGEDYTKITFKPDLARFGLSEIDDDFYSLLQKRVYDLAGCVRGIKVFLNNERIKVKNFQDYVKLYTEKGKENATPLIYERISDRWEVAFTVSDGQFNQVSFVNSICTVKGGTHVNNVADQIVHQLIDAVKKKDKKGIPLKPFQAKSHLWLFVNCAIVNPTFDSQTKETLTLRASAFGSDDFMKKVLKSGVVDSVLQYAKFKQDQLMKKTDGSGKRTRISGLTKLDDANNAGGKNASQCTLILTEGDSAKSLAVSGLAVVGRDNFGVFPLRGKLLNVREASHSQIMGNAEISAIKQILGLQQGKVYNDVSSLRYGHLMIMTDQDHDGSHIKGLIINFFDHFWPSLLRLPGFLLEFITPIVKATKGKGANKKEVSFFTIPEYEAWKELNEDGKGWILKYYKGLGTSTTEDAKKYFSDLGKHLKPFSVSNDIARGLIDMAFNKKKADDRKEWLRGYEAGTFMDHSIDEIPIEDFVNKELILFSRADNVRSIPNCVDGFKPGQRKILFSCFKRNLKAEIKVAQLAGYVSEHSAYHHGEVSLSMTIVNMAQAFVGSNNLNLLQPLGQFGTRLQGGKDAASPRYIFTNLSKLARTIFHPHDDPLLAYLNDDGQSIEPEWYIPVIPMLLVNGGEGIGTGWSTAIPNFNPRDIVKNLYHLMREEPIVPLLPWYRGFEGSIVAEGPHKFRVTGIITKIDATTIQITELPIKSWTQNYKELLESWVVGTEKCPAWIKDYREYHTDSKVHFIVHLTEAEMKKTEKEGLEQRFKVSSSITTSNMVAHDLNGRIKKYSSVDDILQEFYDLRLKFYQKRKDFILSQLTAEHLKIENRVRFITEIVTGKLVVHNRKKTELLDELKTRKYDPIYKTTTVVDQDAEELGSDHGFDYLLGMPIWSLTREKIDALNKEKEDKEGEINLLLSRTAVDLWVLDLDSFLAQWESFESDMAVLESVRPENSTQVGGKSKGGKKKSVDAIMKKKKVANGESDEDDDWAGEKAEKVVKGRKAPAVKKEKAEPLKAKTKKEPAIKKEVSVKKTAAVKLEASSSPVAVAKPAPKKKKPVVESDELSLQADMSIMSSSELEYTARSDDKKVVLKKVLGKKTGTASKPIALPDSDEDSLVIQAPKGGRGGKKVKDESSDLTDSNVKMGKSGKKVTAKALKDESSDLMKSSVPLKRPSPSVLSKGSKKKMSTVKSRKKTISESDESANTFGSETESGADSDGDLKPISKSKPVRARKPVAAVVISSEGDQGNDSESFEFSE